MRQLKVVFLSLICMGIISFLPNLVCAAVNGPCVNCHTMHNSQDGTGMELYSGETGPFRYLTRGSCAGCHTGTNVGGGTNEGVIPYVYSTGLPNYGGLTNDTLAGGNFYWVAQTGGSAKGHNVYGIPGVVADAILLEAPGNVNTCLGSCHATLFSEESGCEGCHVHVKHHKGGDTTPIADLEDGWFRFCSSSHDGGVRGVEGLEDNDWQYLNSSTDHNEYLGIEGDHTVVDGGFETGNTMTSYCCGCHGNFHVQGVPGVWIRHPSDVVLPATTDKEYHFYTVYDPIAPVARDIAFNWAGGPSSTVTPGTDMVMCLSCHRAHGSPYDDMLRWDYAEMVAGGGGDDGEGCFICHRTKDDIDD